MTPTAQHAHTTRTDADEPAPFEPARCLGCHHRPADPTIGYLCGACEQRLPALLDRIRDGYHRLDPTPHGSGAGPDNTRTGPPVFASRPAARADVLALTVAPRNTLAADLSDDVDERAAECPLALCGHRCSCAGRNASHPPAVDERTAPDTPRARTRGIERAGARAGDARSDLPPVLVVLGRVADRCRADGLLGPLRGPRSVDGEWLRLSSAEVLVELPARWWVGEVLDDLAAADRAIRNALGEHEPSVPLGRCPRQVMPPRTLDADGRPAPRVPERCGGQVRSRDGGRAAACTSCPHRWHGAASVHALAGRAGAAMLDLPALAAYLDGLGYGEQPAPRMRKWAQLDRWERERVGTRTLYRLGDALASARARRGLPVLAPTVAAVAS